MKIVQIGPFPLIADCIMGGVEASVYGLTLEQSKNNKLFVVDIPRYGLKNDFTEKIEEITVFRFFTNGKNNYFPILRLKAIFSVIRTLEPDICHIHTTGLFSFFAYIYAKLGRIPTIVTLHGLIHIEMKNQWHKQHTLRNFLKCVVQSSTEFVFLSICPIFIVDTQYVVDGIKKYKRQFKILRFPICKVIPQGVNPAFFQIEQNIEKNHLLSIGAFIQRKGHLFLIDAMQKVKVQFPDFTLTIIGASTNNYYQMVQEKIKEKDLSRNIKLYLNTSFEEIIDFFRRTEIFVLHSEEESQGIVFCEAMAAGKPIIATNVGGVPCIVEHNVNGLLSSFEDIDSFANNVIRLLQDDILRKKISTANRIHSLRYSWTNIADEIMELYETLLK